MKGGNPFKIYTDIKSSHYTHTHTHTHIYIYNTFANNKLVKNTYCQKCIYTDPQVAITGEMERESDLELITVYLSPSSTIY